MAEIVGTITNLSDFLSKTQVCLSVKPNDPQQQIICLEADRKYSIPAFQREVRWDDNNLKMLLLPTVSWALFSKILSWNFRSLSTRLPARWISKNGRLLQISFLWFSIR